MPRALPERSTRLVRGVSRAWRSSAKGELTTGIACATRRVEIRDGELSYKLAECYSLMGDKLPALRLLKKSIDRGFFCYPYFISDPLLENIRDEAQYAVLIEAARQRHERFKQMFF